MRYLPINYPGLEQYSISEEGEVIGKDGVRKLSQFKISRGYMHVGLYIAGERKRKFAVHRLVALTFVPNPENKPQVDHIDGNKLNNHYTNLQWLTGSENVAKAFQQGRVGSRKGKLSGKLTGLYLTHRAIELLGTVDNKSKFVSKLVEDHFGTPAQNTPTPKNTEVENLLKNNSEANASGVSSEQPCCLNELQPCKHWVWDTQTGEGYRNVLSGRFLEVE